MAEFDISELIHDWNLEAGDLVRPSQPIEFDDETLRDGLQSPSVTDPPIETKIEILHLMDRLGIHTANIGLPGAGPRAVADVTRLAKEIVDSKLSIGANCAARTVKSDIDPVARISQDVGLPIECCTFIGSSPIRQYAEGWDVDWIRRTSEEAVSYAVGLGLPVMYVTEDTTRARPETLEKLYTTAIEAGAARICLADTVGHATPDGARNLVRWAKRLVRTTGGDVRIDWHGHRDRGFGLANALAALVAGADRVHGTGLGIGERVGNAEMDLLLVNLNLLGWIETDLSPLPDYCRLIARATGVPLPANYPVVGEDAFRTGTGVHAAAVIKAARKGDAWLADRVYSGVPAGLVGRRQEIEIGHMSGRSNVVYWLESRGLEAEEALVDRIFDHAKRSDHTLTDAEIESLLGGDRAATA
ncbi:MAG TPA: 2-isopropylmalate synthase [Gemmatimonadota bacterium]|nr:2-isopropylmalate synthase [Gemmatimonadota bacterium]